MIKNILAVGDSFTYGEELSDRNLAYPAVLGNKLGANVVNMGLPGGGTKQIVRNVIEYKISLKPLDLVVIGWSSPGRTEFADEAGTFDIWPGYQGIKFYESNPWRLKLLEYFNRYHNERWLYKNYLFDIITTQAFLKQHNIKYVMTVTFTNEHYHKNLYHDMRVIANLIDRTYFIDWPNAGMAEWVGEETPRGPRGHFLEQGHEIVAERIYEHIRHLGWVS